ncbi:MAG: hypothetical protein M3162_05510 [Thermoproteota archaeon]|nr:hypothetical protein [Thermoproteota archaeon]
MVVFGTLYFLLSEAFWIAIASDTIIAVVKTYLRLGYCQVYPMDLERIIYFLSYFRCNSLKLAMLVSVVVNPT